MNSRYKTTLLTVECESDCKAVNTSTNSHSCPEI